MSKVEEGEAGSGSAEVVLDEDYTGGTSAVSSKLTWQNEPKSAVVTDTGLRVTPNPATDYWRDTYYTPLMRADNAAFLNTTLEGDFVMEVSFDLHPFQQFDQAGVMFRLGPETWMKTGIEHVDGVSRVSVVVTNTYSDWSTQDWHSKSLNMRVHRINGCDLVVEYRGDEEGAEWTMVRIARFHPKDGRDVAGPMQAGVYVACPAKKASDFCVDFKRVKITRGGRAFHHTA